MMSLIQHHPKMRNRENFVARLVPYFLQLSKRYHINLFLFRLCFVVLVLGSNIFAGTIAPEIASELAATSEPKMITVEIAVNGGITAVELNAYLDSTCETLADRRREGVLRLQERAKQTQAELLASLREMKNAGLVKKIESHWLTNTISVELLNTSVEVVANYTDVTELFRYPEITPIVPQEYHASELPAATQVGGVGENIRYIGADTAWEMGYTGKGRIVCALEMTGADGSHPAIVDNWKGRDGNLAAAWVGPWSESGFPATTHQNSLHGTHVIGTIVGHDDLTGDTIGVAPGADWIGGAGPGWEWAANPDGDPYTTDDVPDVINISFGTSYSCHDQYWDMIDMTEALGIVNIIAIGNNSGTYTPGHMTGIASRADDSLTNFAVGSIDHRNGLIYWSSSRGPSSCDSVSIKPNVAAPGAYVRSSIPGGEYMVMGGTSMAAPHVSGAVAILRQYAPNASVRRIKEALLAGCTPRGAVSPNNDYGWGVISIPASLEFLSSAHLADLKIINFDYAETDVRDTIIVSLRLKNRGVSVDDVYAKFANDQDGISILTDSIHFGTVGTHQTSTADSPFLAVFDDTMSAGASISIDYTIHGADDYLAYENYMATAGIEGEFSTYTHENDQLQFTLSNNGQFTEFFFAGDSMNNWIHEASLMIGTDYSHVSDNFRIEKPKSFRNVDLEPDNDFWIDISDSLQTQTPGDIADHESSCIFTDGLAENRIGISVQQKSYSWDESPDKKYILLQYIIENVSSATIDGMYVGLALDWKYKRLYNLDYDCEGDFSHAENLGYIFKRLSPTDSSYYRGVTVLNDEGVASYRLINQVTYSWKFFVPGFSDSAKFGILSEGLVDTNLTAVGYESLMHVISTGPFYLLPGESDTAYFAIIGADSLNEMKSTALNAREKVMSLIQTQIPEQNPEELLPGKFVLQQNFPNPFNPETVIEYELPSSSNVTIEIFNILGQKIRTLIDSQKPAGYHSIVWDGKDNSGTEVSTGIYFYRLKTGEFGKTKKMLFLK